MVAGALMVHLLAVDYDLVPEYACTAREGWRAEGLKWVREVDLRVNRLAGQGTAPPCENLHKQSMIYGVARDSARLSVRISNFTQDLAGRRKSGHSEPTIAHHHRPSHGKKIVASSG